MWLIIYNYTPIHLPFFKVKYVQIVRFSQELQCFRVENHLFQIENHIPWEDLGNGISRQVFGYDERIMLVKAKFEKGAIGELHEHHHTQVTYVASGVFEATIGGKKQIINQGDGFYVPPNVIHGCICLEPGTLIDSFTPHREDFL
ncbi:MAG: cupin domain-containing protein [Pedobacter sp.]|nr:MAG: cupin domain-containing protein [Pedobacter sp.]